MTNYDYIRSLSPDELAEYIYSVFITGLLLEKGILDNPSYYKVIDYKSWLMEERIY